MHWRQFNRVHHGGGYFVAGAVAGVATTLVVYTSSPDSLKTLFTKPHKALRFGTPESSKIRYFSNFVSQVDFRTKNPLWVLEHIPTAGAISTVSRKGVHYKEDEEIEQCFRGLLAHYRGSGYDRGHMSPAANNKDSLKAMRESFLLSNCCPQVGKGFNQDYWARFERFIHDVVKPACDDVYVVTGPLYLEEKKRLQGPSLQDVKEIVGPSTLDLVPLKNDDIIEETNYHIGLAVPSHFYKVILGQVSGKKETYVLGAFVMPNAQIHPKTPLIDFQVDVRLLEQIAGISFFPKLKYHSKHHRDVCSLHNCKLPLL